MSLNTTDLGESGSRIAFCHGLFGQGRNWSQVAKAFQDRHRVTLIDLPHHGRSDWPERVDLIDMADEVASLATEDDPVTLVGHSLGGKVAMLVALRHPGLIERLCVVDVSPVAYPRTGEFRGYIDAMSAMDLDALERRADADAALAPAVSNPTVRGFLLQNLRRSGAQWRWQIDLETLGRDLEVLGGWPQERLDGVEPYAGSVVWIAGERSDYVSDEYVPVMERLFPRTRRVTVKGAGHWVHSEQPEVFVEVLRRFVGCG